MNIEGKDDDFYCQKVCHDILYDSEAIVTRMVEESSDCRIPSEFIPYCPVCGEHLVPYLRIDGFFVENEDWQTASDRYRNFV